MKREHIPEDLWGQFVIEFSREHEGWPVTIELIESDAAEYAVARGLPLQGMSFDTRGSRPASLEIAVGESPDEHISHVVDLPMEIRMESDDERRNITLEIEPAHGPRTLLIFHGPRH